MTPPTKDRKSLAKSKFLSQKEDNEIIKLRDEKIEGLEEKIR